MKKTWIKLAIVTLAAAGAVTVAGCKKSGEIGHIKIGILAKNPSTVQNQRFLEVLNEYAEDKDFDVEFIMSEAISDSNKEREVIETWATAGVNGVISCVDSLAEDAKGELFEANEIYFMNYSAPSDTKIANYTNDGNEYYLGGFGASNTDEESCYTAMKAMLEGVTGEKSFALGTAMKDNHVEMFVNRYNGIMRAINEWKAIEGNSIKGDITEIAGFSDLMTPVTNALAEHPDFIFAEAGAEYWRAPMQEAMSKDSTYNPVFACVDSLKNCTWIEEGWLDRLLCTNDDRIALAFGYLYNFCCGYKNVKPNSTEHQGKMVENIPMDQYTTENLAAAKALTTSTLYTVDQIKNVCVRFNENATYETFTDVLYGRA